MTLLLVCFCAPFVVAQDEYNKFEIYGGYSRDISTNTQLSYSGPLSAFCSASSTKCKKLNGFNASATYNFSRYLGVKIDFAEHFGGDGFLQSNVTTGNVGGNTKISRANFQGGIQIKNNSKEVRFKPFGHILAGINRQTEKFDGANNSPASLLTPVFGSDKITSTGFATTFGGGLDIRVSKRIDIRVAQFN